jgi:hypothetical protein
VEKGRKDPGHDDGHQKLPDHRQKYGGAERQQQKQKGLVEAFLSPGVRRLPFRDLPAIIPTNKICAWQEFKVQKFQSARSSGLG